MALTKKDLGQIRETVKEAVLETMEPMMIANQKEFEKIDVRFEKIDSRFDKLDEELTDFKRTNSQEHEQINLRLDNVAYRFELVALQKRVEILEKKVAHKN